VAGLAPEPDGVAAWWSDADAGAVFLAGEQNLDLRDLCPRCSS